MAYQFTVHSDIGFLPFKMLYGRQPRLPAHMVVIDQKGSPGTYESQLTTLTKSLIEVQLQEFNTLIESQVKSFVRD